LPEPISGLHRLALNLRWSWHAPTRALFERIDPARWDASGHNPIVLLAELSDDRLAELAADESFVAAVHDAVADLDAYLGGAETWFGRRHGGAERGTVAYFSAEFGITECLRIFSGG